MKIAIFTLTRDRLEYTKRSFKSLKEKAGYQYDHYVIDNGSTDGTQEWLRKQKDLIVLAMNKENKGISAGCNRALETILKKDYDLIIKMDNDCEIVSSDVLKEIVDIYQHIPPFFIKFMLSPKVEGLNHPVPRIAMQPIGGHQIGITNIIGGIFQPVPAECYRLYKYDEKLPKAKGQDEHLNGWFKAMGGQVGYIEDLVINHMDTTDGQKKKYPAYFKRKVKEENGTD